MISDALQVARIALLKSQLRQACLRRSPVSCLNEVFGNIDSHNFGSQSCEGKSSGSISAAEVQNPERHREPQGFNECLPGLTHESGNLGEVAFLP